MPILPSSVFRVASTATLIGGLACTGAACANTYDPSQTTMDQATPMQRAHEGGERMHERGEHVEQRINTLHEKLKIKPEQEAKWASVAQTMRDNENSMSQLIKQRYENRKTMTAVDDLQSYETIAQAHADGLKRLIPVFQSLYDDLSDDQKGEADEAFGRFEGHRGDRPMKKHG